MSMSSNANVKLENVFIDALRTMFLNGAAYRHLMASLPQSASELQRLTFVSFLKYAHIEAFGRRLEDDDQRETSAAAKPAKISPEDANPSRASYRTWEPRDDSTGDMEAAIGWETPGSLSTTVPFVDPVRAMRYIAEQLHVPVEHLVVPTPPDGLCLYHCFTAWELKDVWMQFRRSNGFCSEPCMESLHIRLASKLRGRLIRFLRKVQRHGQADRIELNGAVGFPGSDELPFLAELLQLNIVEHDLQHPAQPSFTHSGGNRGTMHIGYTLTQHGAPHWVLLNSWWTPQCSFDSVTGRENKD